MGLECICRCCLEIAGYGKGVEIVTKWPDPLPSDPLATAQALMLWIGLLLILAALVGLPCLFVGWLIARCLTRP